MSVLSISKRAPRALSKGPGDPNDLEILKQIEPKIFLLEESRARIGGPPAQTKQATIGSYFFMNSGNPTLDRVTVAVVAFPFGALVGALFSAGNPFIILGAGALASYVLYAAGSGSSS